MDFMILARNIIALARINDVTGTTYYYKSQVSTAAKPAKPTAATPSGWSTTEPAYNAANSVYVTVKTTYSDNSFSYSDVSLASAYEGAKEAHNTAASAKSTAEAAMEQSVEYIIGTQTGSSTGSWTGVTADAALAVGKTIAYKLPIGGSGNASLTLTLAGGSKTAAIPVYLNTTRVTTHFGAGAVINMTYDGSAWRASSIPNSNNYDRIQYKASVTAVGAIAVGRLGVFNSAGKLMLLSNTPFDVSKPILYIGTEYKTGALTQTNNYISWGTAFSLANTVSGFSGTAGATVYIKGTLNGSMFTPASGVLTTTPPTSEDGYTYILLGLMSTTVNAVLAAEHPMFRYYNGGFKTISQISYEAFVAANAAYEKAYQAMPKYTTCSSAGSATAKVTASITNFDTSLPAGMRVSVLMANANTAANPTLSVSSTPAYPILTSSGEAITADNLDQVSWPQNALVTFVFDGAHWRIDDSVALTKIDHILTEDLWSSNRNSFINLNDGVFNYGQGAFQWDGSQLHITGDVDASGTLHGAKIDGEELSIVANGEVEVTPTPEEDPELSYVVALLTTEPSSDDPDGTRTTYKGLALRADILKGSPGRLQSGCEIDLDPLDGSVGISGDQFFVALRNPETGHYQEFLAARTRGTEREFTVSGNVQVDGKLTAKPKSQSRSIQTVSGITVGSLQVYTSAGFCAVTLELTSKTTLSDWTTIATGMPIPAVTWYDTMTNWENAYHRPYRVAVTTSGNLNIRYGAGSSSDATAYRISFVYPMAT